MRQRESKSNKMQLKSKVEEVLKRRLILFSTWANGLQWLSCLPTQNGSVCPIYPYIDKPLKLEELFMKGLPLKNLHAESFEPQGSLLFQDIQSLASMLYDYL